MQGAGFDNYPIDHEDANGQFERTSSTPSVHECDRAILFR